MEDISRYLIMPAVLFEDERVSTGSKMLYMLINGLSNKYGYCFANNDYLADKLHVKVRQIQNCLKELEEYHYIWKAVPYTDGNTIRKIFVRGDFSDSKEPRNEIAPPYAKNCTPTTQKIAPPLDAKNCTPHPINNPNTYSYPYTSYTSKNTTKNYLENTNITPIAPYEEGAQTPSKFQEFWASYPRKKDKKKAEALFARIPDIDNEFPKIMEGLERDKQSQQWNENDGKFIPYPSTWLNRERWKDEGSTKTNKQAFDEWLDPDGTFGGIVKNVFK